MKPLMVNGLGRTGHTGVAARQTGDRKLLGRTIHRAMIRRCQFIFAAPRWNKNSFLFNELD
jgi:hypothetical protein